MSYKNTSWHYYDFGDKHCNFRSGWELNYAFYLEWLKQQAEIKDWEYEPERYHFYITEGNTKIRIGNGYLPDFRVTENNGKQYLVEIKGREQGMAKLKKMKKHYPEIEVRLVGKSEYNTLKKQLGKMLNFV